MPKYRLKSGSHSIHRVDKDPLNYNAGVPGQDVLELTKEQATTFDPGRLEEIKGNETDEVKSNASDETKTATTQTEWTAVLSQGVMDVRAAVAALDNPDDLKALQKEEEKSGSPRKMVLDAIDKRMGELKNSK